MSTIDEALRTAIREAVAEGLRYMRRETLERFLSRLEEAQAY